MISCVIPSHFQIGWAFSLGKQEIHSCWLKVLSASVDKVNAAMINGNLSQVI